MRIYFTTLGCKVNQYETQILMQMFASEGFDICDKNEDADVCVINSCTVTDTGDKKTRQILRKTKRESPNAVIALTGCLPQAFPDIGDKLPEADIITGTKNRRGLIDAVKKCLATGERVINIAPHVKNEEFEAMSAAEFHERTRAFVKIEDGCERYCSYCIIPTARGPVRSKPIEAIVAELSELAKQDYKEIVLVGINLSCYGKDIGLRLIDAIEAAAKVEGIERIRLGSLEPELITDDDLRRMSLIKEFCPQFHLALQSGCSDTLRRMNRHYTADEYMDMVKKIRGIFNNPSITTDIMVGFPGESEKEFGESLNFFNSVGFAKAHVFSYSLRKGTRAAELTNQVHPSDKAARSKKLIAAEKKCRHEFLNSQVGTVASVLFEQRHGDYFDGYSLNYTPIRIYTEKDLQGVICNVKIVSVENDFCIGELQE